MSTTQTISAENLETIRQKKRESFMYESLLARGGKVAAEGWLMALRAEAPDAISQLLGTMLPGGGWTLVATAESERIAKDGR